VPLCDPRSPLISIIGADFDRAAFRLSVFKPANFHDVGAAASSLRGCPDILALDTGDFAVIGIDITAESQGRLPPTVGCGPDERVVWIPRRTLVLAKADIPAA